jgi:CHAD domain-containing protein
MAKAREIPGLDGAMTYGDAAALTIEVRAQEIFDHEDGVLDVHEIERVHAMRVATRRLRAVLEIYEPCFPRKTLRPVLAEVKELADALGARRDPDVELLALEQFVASVGPDERDGVQVFIDRTRAEQAEGNVRLAAALEQARRTDLRARLAELAQAARVHVAEDDEPDDEHDDEDDDEMLAEDPAPAPAFERHDLGEHPHGLGRLGGVAPASANQDTGW